jgi:hypothetical protein
VVLSHNRKESHIFVRAEDENVAVARAVRALVEGGVQASQITLVSVEPVSGSG